MLLFTESSLSFKGLSPFKDDLILSVFSFLLLLILSSNISNSDILELIILFFSFFNWDKIKSLNSIGDKFIICSLLSDLSEPKISTKSSFDTERDLEVDSKILIWDFKEVIWLL